jgi:hypothetical protein
MSDERGVVPRAVRLICTADEQGVRVVSRRRVEMVVPPSELIGGPDEPSMDRRTGFWVEVRDARERPLYRRVIADPLPGNLEVSAGGGNFTRRKIAPGEVTFAVLVPDLGDGDHVSLLRGTPSTAGRLRARSGEVARLPLRDLGRSNRDSQR